jgi:hypothetical protein
VHAHGRSHRLGDSIGVGERAEVYKGDVFAVAGCGTSSGLERQARLADATGSEQRQKASRPEQTIDIGELSLAADEASEWERNWRCGRSGHGEYAERKRWYMTWAIARGLAAANPAAEDL